MREVRTALPARDGGFTLVEMLVAMTLVVMMMLMFASIFGTAVGSMRDQRALANNDQKARALTALLRSDLRAATFKSQLYSDALGLVPLALGDLVDPNQRGYFYIGENFPGSDSDDVLQFTIWVPEPLVGRARLIGRPDGSGPSGVDLNQPDGDDGILNNGITWSRAAEVSYFLRGGTLYRRLLLLRDPLPHSPPYPSQPTMNPAGQGANLAGSHQDRLIPFDYDGNADLDPVTDSGGSGTSDFWNDFDLSASRVWSIDDNGNGSPDPEPTDIWRLHFHSLDSLDNSRGTENSPLGLPRMRFGHDPLTSQPLEWGANPSEYIGRFTHEETSHPDFGYPGIRNSNFGTPFERAAGGLTFFGGQILEYAGGPRSGEDIVMTGVEAFNIEVLDEGWTLPAADRNSGGFPKFVNLGQDILPGGSSGDPNNEFAGDFSSARRLNPSYGFLGNRFDTWHPEAEAFGDTDPPYRPLFTENPDLNVYNMWAPTTGIAAGDVLVVGNGSIAYECLIAGTTGTIEPEWPLVPGSRFSDGTALWRAIDNRIGLKMIRITIRYRDTQTGGLRQLTIYHSFVESRKDS